MALGAEGLQTSTGQQCITASIKLLTIAISSVKPYMYMSRCCTLYMYAQVYGCKCNVFVKVSNELHV